MFFLKSRRKFERRPYAKRLRYYLTALQGDKLKVKELDCEGISVDISEEGLGMITDYPLKEGDILFFKDEIKVDDIIATSAVVKWVKETMDNRYRVGLEFRMIRLIKEDIGLS